MSDKNDKNNKKNKGKNKEEDKALWELYTSDIDPLDPDKDISFSEADKIEKPPAKSKRVIEETIFIPPPMVETVISDMPAQIDKRTEMKLKRGQMPIDARIDLHGLYQKDAKERLARFIEQSYFSGMRCVLVVTGKGKLILEGEKADENTPGVIRRNFRSWLAEPPLNTMVLRAERAQIKDGGEGAFYVLLRKRR